MPRFLPRRRRSPHPDQKAVEDAALKKALGAVAASVLAQDAFGGGALSKGFLTGNAATMMSAAGGKGAQARQPGTSWSNQGGLSNQLIARLSQNLGAAFNRAPEELEEALAEQGLCYSADTEVLTEAGWKRFPDVDIATDRFATRHPKTGAFEWQSATHFHHYGPERMFHFSGRSLDALVTGNHRMLVEVRDGRRGQWREEIWTARDLFERIGDGPSGDFRIPQTSKWEAPDLTEFRVGAPLLADECVVCGYGRVHCDDRCATCWNYRDRHDGADRPPDLVASARSRMGTAARPVVGTPRKRGPGARGLQLRLTGDDFAAFMGMWLAEGSVVKGRKVRIAQQPTSKGWKPFEALLERVLGRVPYYDGRSWEFSSAPLAAYLVGLGHAKDKFIPPEVKNLSARQLRIFWEFYRLGDGSTEGSGRTRIVTASERMAGDLQEVAQKMGQSASVRGHDTPESVTSDGRRVRASYIWVVTLRTAQRYGFRIEQADPCGDVFCVAVPNETLYVRRNGYPLWACNSWGPPFPPGRPLDPFWGYRRPARLWDFSVGENVQVQPRSGRISFATLEAIWNASEVAQVCSRHIANDVRSLNYSFMPPPGTHEDVSSDLSKIRAFFEYPDKRLPFRAWLYKYLMDVLRFDAGAFYVRRNGVNEPIALEVVSGKTLIPMIDFYGRLPMDEDDSGAKAPDLFDGRIVPAFVQVIEGMPWDWLSADDVLYIPWNPFPDSQYGLAPMESVLLSANTDLRYQYHFLNLFCYDDQTEVLTRQGWRRFDELDGSEEFATRSEGGEFQWQHTKDGTVHRFDYNGPMVKFANRAVDMCLTPNHRMLVRRLPATSDVRPNPSHDWHIREAAFFVDNPTAEFQVPATVVGWKGESAAWFELDPYEGRTSGRPVLARAVEFLEALLADGPVRASEGAQAARAEGLSPEGAVKFARHALGVVTECRGVPGVKRGSEYWWLPPTKTPTLVADGRLQPSRGLRMPMDAWMRFLGFWIAEGSARSSRGTVSVCQSADSPRPPAVESLLAETGLKWTRTAANGMVRWETAHRVLCDYLRSNCGHRAWEKRVPAPALDASDYLLSCLLDGLLLGDGHREASGQWTYFTTSETLAGQVQEAWQKCGVYASVYRRIQGAASHARRPIFTVQSQAKTAFRVPRPLLVPYNGVVSCVSVPNGIIFVRRNGKAVWSGNTEGTTPFGLMKAPPDLSDPAQISEWQATWDALMAGDQTMLNKLRWVPAGTDFQAIRPQADNFDAEFPLFLMRRICAAFGVTPNDLGWTDCYDEETECLTDAGWKRWDELERSHKVACFNPSTKSLEYHHPSYYYAMDYEGDMLQFKGRGVDVMVTPHHRMWAWRQTQDRTRASRPWRQYLASELEHASSFGFADAAGWDAEEMDSFVLPSVPSKTHPMPDRCILADDWIEFVGYMASEGCVHEAARKFGHYNVSLSQSLRANPEQTRRMGELLARLPIRFSTCDTSDGCRNWHVGDKALWTWLAENVGCGARNKHLPSWFRSLGKRQGTILLDALMLGDGCVDRRPGSTGQCYTTFSAQLADEVQELALHLGYRVKARCDNVGRWRVMLSASRDHHLGRQHVSRVPYSGTIWCVEVPHHLFVTRRHGVIGIHGNTVNRASAGVQVDVQWRVGTVPLLRHVEDIINLFISQHLHLRGRISFDKGQEVADRLSIANTHQVLIDAGVESPDEVRMELGKPVNYARPTGRYVNSPRFGPVPLLAIESMAGKIDPETYGPAKSQALLDHPFVSVPGVGPVLGTPEYKAAQQSTAHLQREILAASTGKPTSQVGIGSAQPVAPPPDPANPAAKAEDDDASAVLDEALALIEALSAQLMAKAPDNTGGPGVTREFTDPLSFVPDDELDDDGIDPPGEVGGRTLDVQAGLRKEGATAGVTAATGIQGSDLIGTSNDEKDDDEDVSKALADSLRKWRENARNRLRKGQPPRRFEDSALPAQVADAVWSRLQAANTREQIDSAFAAVLTKQSSDAEALHRQALDLLRPDLDDLVRSASRVDAAREALLLQSATKGTSITVPVTVQAAPTPDV